MFRPAALSIVAIVVLAAPADSQVPISFEVYGTSANPTGDLADAYRRGNGAGFYFGFNFNPIVGIFAGLSGADLICDHPDCGDDVETSVGTNVFGVSLTPLPDFPVHPWLRLGLAQTKFSQEGRAADGTSMTFDASVDSRNVHAAAGVGIRVGPYVAIRAGISYVSYEAVRRGESGISNAVSHGFVGPPIGNNFRSGNLAGLQFDVSYLSPTLGVRVFLGPRMSN